MVCISKHKFQFFKSWKYVVNVSACHWFLLNFSVDLQLDVKGCRDVYASFDKYVEVERLEGDNKYHAEEHGLQVSYWMSVLLWSKFWGTLFGIELFFILLLTLLLPLLIIIFLMFTCKI